MTILNQNNHRAPVVVDKDGKSFTSNRINPNDNLKLFANVQDTGVALGQIQSICQLLRIAENLNSSGFSVDFIPDCYHVDLLGDAPTVYFNNIAGTDWGGIRWNPSTLKLQFRHTVAGIWADLSAGGGLVSVDNTVGQVPDYLFNKLIQGNNVVIDKFTDNGVVKVRISSTGGGGGGGGTKISQVAGNTEYKMEINATNGDSELFRVVSGVPTRIMRFCQDGSIWFDNDVYMGGTNSEVDFRGAIATIILLKALSITTTNWTIGSDGISTGLVSKGGYTQDV